MAFLSKPRDFFVYIATPVALYASVGAIIALLFAVIDASFVDQLSNYYYGYDSGARFAMATIIVAFPAYLLLSYWIRRDIVRDQTHAEIGVRKWYVYLTIFLTGALVAGDLISLIYTFLNGEITTRFILKVLTILIVSGAVFAYYLYDLGRVKRGSNELHGSIAVAAGVLALAILILGFVVLGTPGEQRDRRFDSERENELQSIHYGIESYYRDGGKLPESLEELEGSSYYYADVHDPETGEQYGYRIINENTFELCATFTTTTETSGAGVAGLTRAPAGKYWGHESGEVCFESSVLGGVSTKSDIPLVEEAMY